MRIAVTGASGFIGRHVVAEAERRGHDVRGIAGPGSAQGIDLRTGTGLNDALRGADVVIHCAAAMGGDLAAQHAITVEGTRNLLNAMKESGVRDIVLIGTFAIYDYAQLRTDARLDESSPLEAQVDARAPYIRVKQEQEQLVRSTNGVAWTIVRPGLVYGPGRTWFHNLGAQLPGGVWLCLAPESVLPLTHVSNCAQAIVLAAENSAARGKVLNLVDDDLPARGDYIAELAARQTPAPKRVSVPWSVLSRMAKAASSVAGHRVPDLLNPASLNARCKPLQYSNARAKEVLGWQPSVQWRSGVSAALEAKA
ncbi:MAG TPA: NAD(P)-dependent oxidoreductase [Longimicrobiales bacterium]